jgi:hypothetical protein
MPLQKGLDINCLDETKAPPLFRSCESGQAETAVYLIKRMSTSALIGCVTVFRWR